MLIHQEELAALDEGVLVFDLTHVLEVVAVLRHAHTEEAATLRLWNFNHVFVNLHSPCYAVLLFSLTIHKIKVHGLCNNLLSNSPSSCVDLRAYLNDSV